MGGLKKGSSLGKGVGIAPNVEPQKEEQQPKEPEAIDFTKLTTLEQLDKRKELQDEMGQTGDEAGKYDLGHGSSAKMYVNCSKSFDINYYLATGKVGSPQSTWTHGGLYTLGDIKNDIAKMDSGMKPLPDAVKGYKYADGDALGRMLGMDSLTQSNVKNLINTLETSNSARQDFENKLKGTSYTHKGYTSVSYLPQHSTYDSLPVRLDFKMNKGTKAIVTNNTPEHEIIGNRNSKYNFTGKFKVEEVYSTAQNKKIKQLVIECEI